ncbi:MAG: M91 family zinc metallopeptidase, partial [Nocardioidaceae bacterium]
PTESDTTGILTIGDQTIVNGGAGDDEIRVFIDPATGEQIVVVNGTAYRVPAGQEIVVRGGGGNDTIGVPGGAGLDLTIAGGEGDDRIQGGDGDETILGLGGDDEVDAGEGDDRVSGGADRDYLNAGAGNDIVDGGLGGDTVYGLDGNDTLSGGEGQDYLEGGAGDDTIHGGAGDDILSGGLDDDTLRGGSGDDVSYAGRGDDTTYGGSGTDTSHSERGDSNTDTEQRITVEIPDTTYFINIEGSPEFVARVGADIEMLRSSPRGQEMLENLQDNYDDSGFLGMNKDTLTIREYDNPADPNNSTASNDGNGNYEINYNTRIDTIEGAPPNVVLYHEAAHVYDYMNGTFRGEEYAGDDTTDHGIREGERQATGLPIDHDGDPSTPEQIDPDHPFGYTENGMRDEMGLPNRDHYR